jgi:outer membrane protein
MMSSKLSVSLLVCGMLGLDVFAQEKLNLEACVQTAWNNSLSVRQSEISQKQALLQKRQAYWARFPSASANVQEAVNAGRSIDLTSYQFVNQVMNSTNFGLNLSMPLYSGFQLKNNLEKTQIDAQATDQDLAQTRRDLALAVSQAYLSVLLAEENAEIFTKQLELSQAQLARTQKLIDAGTLPENTRYDLEAQIARDEQNTLNGENNIRLAYLNLKTIMNYGLEKELKIEKVTVVIPEKVEKVGFEQVYNEAQASQPNLVAAQLREKSAEMSVEIAKGALQPTISAYANLSTNFSSTGTYFTGDTIYATQNLNINLGGQSVNLQIPQAIPERKSSPFFKQLGSNFTQAIGVRAQVPIFNGFQTRINIERAKLSQQTAALNTMQVKNRLQSDIQKAILEADAAERRLKAAEKTLKATQNSVDNSRKRFDAGLVNMFEYLSVQNTLISAQSNLAQARYDYLFKLKVIDFYRGI